jgi:hypothetical protein
LGESRNGLHVGGQPPLEDIVVIGAFDAQQSLLRGPAGIEQGLAVGKGNDVVMLGMDHQGGARIAPDLIGVAKPLAFLEADARHIHPQEAQQGRGPGKAAFDNQPGNGIGVGGGQLQRRALPRDRPITTRGPL